MGYNHFLRSIRALMPQAVWSFHHDVPLAKLETETFLIARLSDWPEIRKLNAVSPFPKGIVPLLFIDTYSPDCVPRGKWLAAGLHGLKWAEGDKFGKMSISIEKMPSIQCGVNKCLPCSFGLAYGVPVTSEM